MAARIEQQLPGAKVTVSIGSFPFLVHLGASGTILELSVHLSRISAGPFTYNGVHVRAMTFDDVDIHIDDLHLSRGQLLHRKVVIDQVGTATVTATLRQASLDHGVGLPITLGDGTVGIGGLSLPAAISIHSGQVTVTVPHQLTFSLTPPPLDVLPCIGRVQIEAGALRLSCSLKRLPAVLAGAVFTF